MKKEVGSIERINFINICGEIDAKVDTGAWRTSLHVDNIYIKNNILFFSIGDTYYNSKSFKKISVKNSFGNIEDRYTIKTKVKLGEDIFNISVSLSNRELMKYKCLIGRRFLYRNKFLVDVNKKFINNDNNKEM
jgi:hypothetical protein